MSSMSGGVALAAAQAAGEQAAAGKKELGNFYRFQQRDKRRNGELPWHMPPAAERFNASHPISMLSQTSHSRRGCLGMERMDSQLTVQLHPSFLQGGRHSFPRAPAWDIVYIGVPPLFYLAVFVTAAGSGAYGTLGYGMSRMQMPRCGCCHCLLAAPSCPACLSAACI